MNEVQTIQGLPSLDSEGSIIKYLAQRNIFRLPLIVHQAMADSIDYRGRTLEQNQKALRKLLLDYIEENYPGYGLGGFVELLSLEAKKISLYLPFGVYIQLVKGTTSFGEEYIQIGDTFKQLTR